MKATVKFEVYVSVSPNGKNQPPGKRSVQQVNDYLREKIQCAVAILGEELAYVDGVLVGPAKDMTNVGVCVETVNVRKRREVAGDEKTAPGPKQFGESSILKPISGYKDWWFTAAMVSSCGTVFGHCSDNYEVESELRKAKVIRTKTESEYSQMFVYFTTRADGLKFLKRLNAYIAQRFQKQARVTK